MHGAAAARVVSAGGDLNKGPLVKVFIIESVVAEVSCVGESCGSAGKGSFLGALWEAGVLGRRGIVVGLHCRMQGGWLRGKWLLARQLKRGDGR